MCRAMQRGDACRAMHWRRHGCGGSAELSVYVKLLIVLIVRGRGLDALHQALKQSSASGTGPAAG